MTVSETGTITILLLVEEGKIADGDPISRYIQALPETTVAVPVNVRPRSARPGHRRTEDRPI